jgi:hypothetical protein
MDFMVAILVFIIWAALGLLINKALSSFYLYKTGLNVDVEGLSLLTGVIFGPTLLVVYSFALCLYIIFVCLRKLYYIIGFKVVVLDINKFIIKNKNKAIEFAPTIQTKNFLTVYLSDRTLVGFSNYSARDKKDCKDFAALVSFLEVDGWRSVDGNVWTKFVRVRDVNNGWTNFNV